MQVYIVFFFGYISNNKVSAEILHLWGSNIFMKIRKCRCSQPSRQGWISEKSMETSSCKRCFCHQKIDQELHWLVKYHEESPTCYSRQLHGWTRQCSGRVGFAESFRLSLLYLRMTNWELQWKQLELIINWDRAVSDDAGQIVKIMYYH